MNKQFKVYVIIDTDNPDRPPSMAQRLEDPEDPSNFAWVIGVGQDIADTAGIRHASPEQTTNLIITVTAHEFGHILNHEVLNIGWEASKAAVIKDEEFAWANAETTFNAMKHKALKTYYSMPENDQAFFERTGREAALFYDLDQQRLETELRMAQKAHEIQEQDHAEFDQQWPEFYARYLMEHLPQDVNHDWIQPHSWALPQPDEDGDYVPLKTLVASPLFWFLGGLLLLITIVLAVTGQLQ